MAFIKDFAWGTATAAYQIEGAHLEDGKGLNIWDIYTRQPGIVTDGYPGDIAKATITTANTLNAAFGAAKLAVERFPYVR
jgi:beta-glucosidase/6-phospho-beta-glucosidase/beta-galactosidase